MMAGTHGDGPRARARRTDPVTSHDAADGVTPHLSVLQRQVLGWAVRQVGGFIDPELQDFFDNPGSTHRTRRCELVDLGLIKPVGVRAYEDKKFGFTVWAATPKGHRVYQEGRE